MIKILPERVINQIAAGEVVERPSSVVKELIDNALDAGAKKISVSIVEGGQSSLVIVDDGCGMSKDEALLSFERHATSKITVLSDLESITTNGFRGEALPSIASISKVTMRTRRTADESGYQIDIAGGKILSVKPVACPAGTTIEMRSLFFNVPARRKFLKGPRSDEIKVRELVCAYALAYPQVDIELDIDGQRTLSLNPQADLPTRAAKIIRGGAVAIEYRFDEVFVQGLIAHPSQAVSDGASLTILVNKRFVSDKFVLRAVKEGFSSTLKEREFPVGVVSVTLPGNLVDVNVHPQKSEVRFAQSQKVFAAVKIAVEEGIKSFRSPMMIDGSSRMERPVSHLKPTVSTFMEMRSSNATSMVAETSPLYQSEANERPAFASPTSIQTTSSIASSRPQQTLIAPLSGRYHSWRYLGQLFTCYLLFEGEGKFFVVDMHAAHERLNYNRLRSLVSSRSETRTQGLLLPHLVRLSPGQLGELSNVDRHLKDLGYDWQIHADGIELLSVPSLLIRVDHERLIRNVTDKETYGGFPFPIEETIAYICARLACHASIRSGHILGATEAYALLNQMESADFATACPHGRPCLLELSEPEIESWFGRDR